MIISNMCLYDFYKYGEKDSYGQLTLSKEPLGQVKMAIYETSQSIQDNIVYKQASFVGLTYALLEDDTVIDYNGLRLKVQYVNNKGRLNQVFMAKL